MGKHLEAWERGETNPDPLMGAAYSRYLAASYGAAVQAGEIQTEEMQ